MRLSHESLLQGEPYRRTSLEGVSHATAKSLHAFMVRLRTCEEILIKEYHPANEMRCPVHFCVGQESVPSALAALFSPTDYMFSHHRTHGYFLAKGSPLSALVAELYGRKTGANGGLAGSQDISMPSHRMFAGAIIGGALSIAVGTALAVQHEGRPEVVVASCGEAASDEGAFWEALQFASLRKLPLVIVCENNRYSVFSDQSKRQPSDEIARRVAAFGLASEAVFGNDTPVVHQTFSRAFQRARAGQGPSFVEAYTYRWCGHVGPDNDASQGYRSDSEIEFWRRNCPIRILGDAMRERGWLDAATEQALTKAAEQEIRDAIAFSKQSEFGVPESWNDLNSNPKTPLADRLLSDINNGQFDQNQLYSIPGPY